MGTRAAIVGILSQEFVIHFSKAQHKREQKYLLLSWNFLKFLNEFFSAKSISK